MAEPATGQEKSKPSPAISDSMTKPGDVIISSLTLNVVSTEEPLDLKPFMMEINLYEDIFSPSQIKSLYDIC